DYASAALNFASAAFSLAGFGQACFAAGMRLLTPTGSKPIEDFRAGDLVLSRPEDDAAAPIEAKLVEETFRRLAKIVHLHVGGRVIRTTDEHPFWTERAGWVKAYELLPGDRLATYLGGWLVVEEMYDTGVYEEVYNLRV